MRVVALAAVPILAVAACSGSTSGPTTDSPPTEAPETTSTTAEPASTVPPTTGPTTTTTSTTSASTTTSAATTTTTTAGSAIVESRPECLDTTRGALPSDVPIDDHPLDFEMVHAPDLAGRDVVASDRGFYISARIPDDGPALSEDGLSWEVFGVSEGPSLQEIGVERLSDGTIAKAGTEVEYLGLGSKHTSMPGLGGTVELLYDSRDDPDHYDLCVPGPDGGVTAYRLPFGESTGYDRVELVGVAGESLVLLVKESGFNRTLVLLDGAVHLVEGPLGESGTYVDPDTGRELVQEVTDDEVVMVDPETGEVVASATFEDTVEMYDVAEARRQATSGPGVWHVAWSDEPAERWQLAEVPGQTPEFFAHISTAVDSRGVIVASLGFSRVGGRLVTPEDAHTIDGFEDFEPILQEQLANPQEYAEMVRTVLPIEG